MFMAIDVRAGSEPMGVPRGGTMSYFNASVFLVLFILAGRYLEGLSRRRTGDAVAALGSMKTLTGILYHGASARDAEVEPKPEPEPEPESAGEPATATASAPAPGTTEIIEVDFIKKGDVLLIPAAAAVPLDSVLVAGSAASTFDESSLTGEARPVIKSAADDVFAGTTNLGPSAVTVRVSAHAGETVLDSIVCAVEDAMTRKAGIERVTDLITGYFVPLIVAIAGLTFGIWILRGYRRTARRLA